ncbi:hypothetical protein JoomaDRAFT_0742 [Galbibacter orientalis DSM 19592]|uniref:Uncharacterized protein n=1 Tax=Galbibacter orientalis DSM 19592 TaxID=926559 RepID=I3C2D3_9FLAO|nr:hypothetical protein [Galbibacter orientalis]EIJ37776.1 hypothetical protein JoomaDRAFT_0742 [Galbibacter orientalis DSM 19592]
MSKAALNKQEKTRRWAIAELQKAKPFDAWVNERPRTEKEIELYHKIRETLEGIASGEKKVYDTVKITTKNGFSCAEFK